MLYQLWDSSYSSFSLSVLRADRWLDASRTCHQLWQAARDRRWPDSGRTCHQLHMASSQRRTLARLWQNLPSAAHGKQPETDAGQTGRTCHQLHMASSQRRTLARLAELAISCTWQAARDGRWPDWQNLPSAAHGKQPETDAGQTGRTCHQLHMASSQRRTLARLAELAISCTWQAARDGRWPDWQNLPSAAHGKQPETDAGQTGRTCHQLWQAARDRRWPDSSRTCD